MTAPDRATRAGVGVFLGSSLVFVAIASAVMRAGGLLRLDAIAHDVLYAAVGPNERFVEGITFFGNNATIVTLVVSVALGLVIARRVGLALRVVFASGVGGLVIVSLKALFHRARPVDQVIPATGFSFPSGHAFASTVFYGMMIVLVWRLTDRPWARALATGIGVILILAVGLSRVYLNVHYLTDVIAGWAAGVAWLSFSLLIADAVERKGRRAVDAGRSGRPPARDETV